MIDAYAIGINIVLNDEILDGVARLESNLGLVQGAVDAINASLRVTGGVLTQLTSQATAFAGAMERAARAASAGGGSSGGGSSGGRSAATAIQTPPTIYPTPRPSSNLPAIIPGEPGYSFDSRGNPTFRRPDPGFTMGEPGAETPRPPRIRGLLTYDPAPGTSLVPSGDPTFHGDTGPNFRRRDPASFTPPNAGGGGPRGWNGTGNSLTVIPQPPKHDPSLDIPDVPGGANSRYFPGGLPGYGGDGSGGKGGKGGKGGAGGHFDPLHAYIEAMIAKDIAEGIIVGPFEAAASVDQKLAILRGNGLTEGQALDAYAQAQKMQQDPKYKTLSIDQLLDTFTSAFIQTRSISDANSLMPELADANITLQGMGQGGGAEAMLDLMRSGDLAGLLNDKNKDGSVNLTRLKAFIVDFSKFIVATGGDAITTGNLLHLFQNAGPTLMNMDEQGREMMMFLAMSLGQQKAGTGINQMGKELIGGRMSKATASYLESLGLLNPKDIIPSSKGGGYLQAKTGSIKDFALLNQSPIAWFEQELGDQIQNMTQAQRDALIGKTYGVAGTAQGARVVAESLFQGNAIARQMAALQGMPTLAGLAQIFTNTPTGAAQGAGSATNALIVTLSQETMGLLKPMLNWYTTAANAATNVAQQHPGGTVLGMVDAAALALWKGLTTWGESEKFGASLAKGGGGLMGKLAWPIAMAEEIYAEVEALHWQHNVETGKESPFDSKTLGFMGQPGELYTPIVAAIVNQTRSLLAAIKGQQAAAMPSGTTAPSPANTAPAPGQAAPHHY